mmetsp:Transcript_35683/g.42990  ORF Transcript_35683/g.42990 Transcript_35683/m.42990 type:complete len:316 (-) Transcript_35683:423-1370(-)|eukprot:CAMPEP_0194355130 /NCGR_PEP_ID=MMETSP0174-20130528/3105_1 /TAXON_ID=216777 /ORGANISM="Proboscia alata, Strain PI-D3" /LENGTH=315 /DNA_ID=CAMNT_0039124307 /DNA_START=54 /DNA_END=1001 /DNA_ORIENTATION=+
MGGDGGVVATNRNYLRGAGKADHTGDATRYKKNCNNAESADQAKQTMTTCALTGSPLSLVSGGVVACPYGRMYGREAALEALLRRRTMSDSRGPDYSKTSNLGIHIRGLKDLYPVRFHYTEGSFKGNREEKVPLCPITGVDLNGSHTSYLVVKLEKRKSKKSKSVMNDETNTNDPNVISERAIKEMGADELQTQFGPFDKNDLIRLAPPTIGGILEEIVQKLELKREKKAMGKAMQNDKKRKNGAIVKCSPKEPKHLSSTPKDSFAHLKTSISKSVDVARANASLVVASSSALSSLFVKESNLSEKEKKDNLFVR